MNVETRNFPNEHKSNISLYPQHPKGQREDDKTCCSYFLFLISYFLFLISYFLFLISYFLFPISYLLFLISYFLFLMQMCFRSIGGNSQGAFSVCLFSFPFHFHHRKISDSTCAAFQELIHSNGLIIIILKGNWKRYTIKLGLLIFTVKICLQGIFYDFFLSAKCINGNSVRKSKLVIEEFKISVEKLMKVERGKKIRNISLWFLLHPGEGVLITKLEFAFLLQFSNILDFPPYLGKKRIFEVIGEYHTLLHSQLSLICFLFVFFPSQQI